MGLDSVQSVKVERIRIEHFECEIAQAVMIEGYVTSVCIPLISEKHLLGALELSWTTEQLKTMDLQVEYEQSQWIEFGRMLGSAYFRHQLKIKSEVPKRAIKGGAAIALQSAHILGRRLQTLYNLALVIKETPSLREQNIDTLRDKTVEAQEIIKRLRTDYGHRMIKPVFDDYLLLQIIDNALSEVDPANKELIQSSVVKVEKHINSASRYQVYVDEILAKQTFVNVIDNAIEAIMRKSDKAEQETAKKVISISANLTNTGKNVEIVIADTGDGMSDEFKEAVSEGRVEGIGALITLDMLYCQDGSLHYDSEIGVGTRAIITLPAASKGDRPCLRF
jgi:signal transduction histidine kinase